MQLPGKNIDIHTIFIKSNGSINTWIESGKNYGSDSNCSKLVCYVLKCCILHMRTSGWSWLVTPMTAVICASDSRVQWNLQTHHVRKRDVYKCLSIFPLRSTCEANRSRFAYVTLLILCTTTFLIMPYKGLLWLSPCTLDFIQYENIKALHLSLKWVHGSTSLTQFAGGSQWRLAKLLSNYL